MDRDLRHTFGSKAGGGVALFGDVYLGVEQRSDE